MAVAAVTFFGLGYWHACGRRELPKAGEAEGGAAETEETKALSQQLQEAHKELGEAREQIEALLERKVYLRLWVKVVPGWTRDPVKARQLAIKEGRG